MFGLSAAYFALNQDPIIAEINKICIVSNKAKDYYKNK